MRKYALLTLAGLALVGTNLPARAADGEGIKFDVIGEVRARMDYWENYTDLNDDNHDNFSSWPYRVRVGVHGMLTDNVAAHVEFQNFGTFGNEWPDQGIGNEDLSGPGNDVQLYQAFLDINLFGGDGGSFRVGRQEMPYGTELLLGDGDFYNGVSFDGIRYMRMSDHYNLNAFYFKLLEGNSSFDPGSNDENLFGADFDWKLNKWGTVGAYWFTAQILDIDSKLDTYGARWNNMPDADAMFDWNIEYALQSGDFGEPLGGSPALDVSGDLLEAWFGFSIGHNFRNRFSVGYLAASGDNDSDDELEFFQPLFGDIHEGGRLGNTDIYFPSDIEDINVMWSGTMRDGKHMFGAAVHSFTEADPLPGANDDLGTEIDLTYDYMPNKVLSFQLGYAQLDGADALVSAARAATLGVPPPTEADTLTRFWAQVRARW